MKHTRSNTPAYLLWVEQRPAASGKGKQAYFEAVAQAGRTVITGPMTTNDIEVEVIYATNQKVAERKDADNINKPTLDALNHVAYVDDRQVRAVTSTVFDKNRPCTVDGHVEYIGRLFYSKAPHVVLIKIYSDTRLNELGGAAIVEQKRYVDWQRDFERKTTRLQNEGHA